MLEYMIGTTRRNGKSLRYLRIKSDAEIGLTGDLVTFTQTQEDKVSVYEVIVGDLLREESRRPGSFIGGMRSRASLSRPITRHARGGGRGHGTSNPWPPLSSLPLWPRRDRSTTPRRRRTPRSLPNGPIPLHIRPERSASTRAASIVASRLTPHRRIGRRTPRRACGPRSPIPPKNGRSGPSHRGP